MARRKKQPRLLVPPRPPQPERPAISVQSPKLSRAVDVFVEYQRAAGKWVIEEGGVRAESPFIGALSVSFDPGPLTLSVLIGDCLQNLRSALDHEVYRQAVQNKGKAWPGLEQAQFPVHADQKSFPSVRGNVLAGLRAEVVAVVESLQPFVAPNDFDVQTLDLLHLAARIDRHRLLHVAAPQPIARSSGRFRPDMKAVEVELTVRVQLVDFVEPRLMNLDVHDFLFAAIQVVDRTMTRMQEAERKAAPRRAEQP